MYHSEILFNTENIAFHTLLVEVESKIPLAFGKHPDISFDFLKNVLMFFFLITKYTTLQSHLLYNVHIMVIL